MGKRTLKLIQSEVDNLRIIWHKYEVSRCVRLCNALQAQLKRVISLVTVQTKYDKPSLIIKQGKQIQRILDLILSLDSPQLSTPQIDEVNQLLTQLEPLEVKSRFQANLSYLYSVQNALDSHAIVSKTDDRGTILSVNSTFCEISGYERAELVGENHRLLNSGRHPPVFFETMWRTILSGANWKGTVCNRRKNGELYWVESTITPVFDETGQLQGFTSIRTDITHQKQLEEKLAQSLEIAEQANQAKSIFLASMTHELRTPLNSVIGYSQLLKTTSLNQHQLDHLQNIESSGKYLLSLINELLDLSSIEAGVFQISMEDVDIQTIIKDTITLVEPLAAAKAIQIEWHAEPTLSLIVKADITRIKQVLINFLTNAIKYNYHEGRIQIEITVNPQNKIRVSVIDQGYGIPQDKQNHVFEAFNRLGFEHSDTEGTGIGLSITKNLIELMHGQVGFESQVGVGSCFWFELPMQQRDVQQKDQNTNQTTGKTLLFVESNPLKMAQMEDLFEQLAPHRLVISPNTDLAIEQAQRCDADIILIDPAQLKGQALLDCLTQLASITCLQHTQFYVIDELNNLNPPVDFANISNVALIPSALSVETLRKLLA